jgi:hypothetical protein
VWALGRVRGVVSRRKCPIRNGWPLRFWRVLDSATLGRRGAKVTDRWAPGSFASGVEITGVKHMEAGHAVAEAGGPLPPKPGRDRPSSAPLPAARFWWKATRACGGRPRTWCCVVIFRGVQSSRDLDILRSRSLLSLQSHVLPFSAYASSFNLCLLFNSISSSSIHWCGSSAALPHHHHQVDRVSSLDPTQQHLLCSARSQPPTARKSNLRRCHHY